MIQKVHLALEGNEYDIVIGNGLLTTAGKRIRSVLPQPRTIIVTDENVATHHLIPLQETLRQQDIRHVSVVLPAGEGSKSFSKFTELVETILEKNPERKTTLIALGGGVIGDLTGFAASVILRGIPFIQMPTTLLSQVDSSVGGKTGINSRYGKNLVGSFYQPRLVLADMALLDTLPPREMLAGYAEVVKYGVINDPEFFEWLEVHGVELLQGDKDLQADAVRRSCESKADIVAQDEREGGVRALLNLGHTFGHALEAETGYGGGLNHGEAVAIGMVLAMDFSVKRQYCKPADAERLRAHLIDVGLPTSPLDIRKAWDIDALVRHCQQDKKVQDGRLTFILARGIGRAFICRDVTEGELAAFLKEQLS